MTKGDTELLRVFSNDGRHASVSSVCLETEKKDTECCGGNTHNSIELLVHTSGENVCMRLLCDKIGQEHTNIFANILAGVEVLKSTLCTLTMPELNCTQQCDSMAEDRRQAAYTHATTGG